MAQQMVATRTTSTRDVRSTLRELEDRLRPRANHTRTIGQLEAVFRAGRVPDPLPDGFLHGRFVSTVTRPLIDAAARRLTDLWMPWLGKTFDATARTGRNVVTASSRPGMRLIWPDHRPVETGGRIEAFPFITWVGPAALDSDLEVLKIDYDHDASPDRILRRILDELVEVDDGFYLGRALVRVRDRLRPAGFFTLER